MLRRCAISAEINSYCDSWVHESSAIAGARKRGDELGAPSPTPTAAATLAVLAAAVRARAVVEIGTGVGTSGLRLLDGMAPDGILTTIDSDGNHQSAAKAAFRDAGVDAGRARQITGEPSEVLPRLADGAYDLVVINDYGADPRPYLEQALRLLRDGGLVVLGAALGSGGAVTDPAQRDEPTARLRAAATSIQDDEQLVSVVLPIADGLLVAAKLG